jgi:superfamily II DNA or RNA helicase
MSDKRKEIQDMALKVASEHKRCGLGISMGVGKTFLGLKHMDRQLTLAGPSFSGKFLVVAPKKSIHESWKEEAHKFSLSYLLDYIEFTTYLSLTKKDVYKYHTVYLDECHNLLYSHEFWLNAYSGDILGLTGTPPRYEHGEKGYMVNTFCPIVFSYITDDAVSDNILNDYKIIIHPISLGTERNVQVKMKDKSFMTSEQQNYEYWTTRIDNARSPKEEQITRIMRMNAMMNFPSKLKYTRELMKRISDKCLVFANTQEQAEDLYPYSYHSKNPNSKENLMLFKQGAIDTLTCVQSLSEGVNIPNLKSCIILHSYSNERKSSQRIGRVLRLNPDDLATIHILVYADTIDEKWIKNALQDFEQTKIHTMNLNALLPNA